MVLLTDVKFSINCGGPEIKISSNQTVYAADMGNLGNSTYLPNNDGTWGVSYTGYDDNSFFATLATKANIEGTNDQELYKTARGAANSLRYYGKDMVNGVYHVDLHFAEIVMSYDGSRQNHGKRKFDVYIQVPFIFLP
jgi:hypothetical protein